MMKSAKVDESISNKVDEQYIFDSDFHLEIGVDTISEYIEDDRVKTKVERFGGPPPNVMPNVIIPYANNEADPVNYHGIAKTADEIQDVKTEFGLDAVTVTAPTSIFGQTNYPKLSTELAKAYNNYLIDNVIDVDRGIYANLVIPWWEPEIAAQEINRVASEKGFVGAHGIMLPLLWGQRRNDPIFEALVDNDLPLACHVAAAGISDLIDSQMRTFVEAIVAGLGTHLLTNVTNMIATGVFDKFPSLNVIWIEAGVQWIPYIANRFDDQYQAHPKDMQLTERLYEADQNHLERNPSEYIYDNMYVSTQPIALPNKTNEARAVLESCHADEMFIFSTDWPHFATDGINWLFKPPVDEELRNKICKENAETAYRLPQ